MKASLETVFLGLITAGHTFAEGDNMKSKWIVAHKHLEAATLSKLQAEIDGHIDQDWQPFGVLVVALVGNQTMYFQAMVRINARFGQPCA